MSDAHTEGDGAPDEVLDPALELVEAGEGGKVNFTRRGGGGDGGGDEFGGGLREDQERAVE
jgi:hypothetical protein